MSHSFFKESDLVVKKEILVMAERLNVLYDKKTCYDIVFDTSFEGLMGTIKSRVAGSRELGRDCLPSSAGSGDDPLPVSGSRDDPLPVSGSGNDPVLASRDDLLTFLEPE